MRHKGLIVYVVLKANFLELLRALRGQGPSSRAPHDAYCYVLMQFRGLA